MSGGTDWEPAAPPPASGPAPLGIGAVLDVGVRILRRRWAVLLPISLVFVGPGALLTAATQFRFNEVAGDIFADEAGAFDFGKVLTQAEFDRLLGAMVPYLAGVVAAGLIATIGTVAMSAVVGADFFHRPMRFGEAVGTALRRALSALAFILVTMVLVILLGIGALLLMAVALATLGGSIDQGGPGLFVALLISVGLVLALAILWVRWAPALPAIANEDLGWRDALRRSWHLSGDNIWRIFAVLIIATIVTALVGALVAQVLALLLVDALATAIGLELVIAESIALALGTVLLAPLLPVLTAVQYFDLRVRRDPPGSLGS